MLYLTYRALLFLAASLASTHPAIARLLPALPDPLAAA